MIKIAYLIIIICILLLLTINIYMQWYSKTIFCFQKEL